MLLTDLVPRVRIVVSEVPENMALIYLQDSAIRFLRKVRLIRSTYTLSSVEDQSNYAFGTSGADTKVANILVVKKNGTELPPYAYTLDKEDQEIAFESNYVPSESDTDDLSVYAELEPTGKATDFPTWIMEEYQEAIVGGALEALLDTPNRVYYNPVASRKFGLKFKRGIVQARKFLASFGTDRDNDYTPSNEDYGGVKV